MSRQLSSSASIILSCLAPLALAACAGELDDAAGTTQAAEVDDGGEVGVGKDVPLDTAEVVITAAEPSPVLDDQGAPVRGTLVFDPEGGRMDLTHLLPEAPREFRSAEALALWAEKHLNAELARAEDGALVATLTVTSGDLFAYDGESDTMAPVDSPVAKILGGRWGYVIIDGEKRCVDRAAPCGAELEVGGGEGGEGGGKTARSISPAQRSVWSGNLGILGSSWITHAVVVHVQGASTAHLGSAGYRQEAYRCGPWGWFWCTRTLFNNSLSVGFNASRFYGNHFNGSGHHSVQNGWKAQAEQWGFGLPVPGLPGNGCNQCAGTTNYNNAGVISETDSICSSHSGSASWLYVMTRTAIGYVAC